MLPRLVACRKLIVPAIRAGPFHLSRSLPCSVPPTARALWTSSTLRVNLFSSFPLSPPPPPPCHPPRKPIVLATQNSRRGLSGDASRDFNPAIARKLVDEEDALLLDVRSDTEFQMGALEEAEHIPYAELPDRVDELEEFTKGNKDKPIVVYCSAGSRSSVAQQILVDMLGYKNVVNLGGITQAQAFAELGKPDQN